MNLISLQALARLCALFSWFNNSDLCFVSEGYNIRLAFFFFFVNLKFVYQGKFGEVNSSTFLKSTTRLLEIVRKLSR